MNQSTLLPNGFQENMTGRRLQSPYQENDLDDSDDSTPFEETPGYAKYIKISYCLFSFNNLHSLSM